MKLSVHLVTWNGAKYVPYLFDSLRKQTFLDWELFILDNASTDGMVDAMKKELASFPVPYHFIKSSENTGFAGGHNRLYRETEHKNQETKGSEVSEYFLCLNQDMVLTPECLGNLVRFMDTHQDVAAVSPRLMKWDFSLLKGETPPSPSPTRGGNINDSFTDVIDTLGLKVFRSRRVIEKYTGKEWSVIKPKMHLSFRSERWRGSAALEVFGVSGALPMFRREATTSITFSDGTFFDESYHSYKEDVDVAFRLRSAGYKSYVLLDTVAYHDRSAAGPPETNDRAALKNKKTQSTWVKYHSYKNHLMTLYKNEYGENLALDFLFILWYELKKFGYFLVFDRGVLKGLGEVWRLRHELKQKRKLIKEKRRVHWKEIRKWWR